ncbi:NAD(P)/FAD-dependent oxidoreductase [Chromobacterium sp. IIBBL 290-4]|uniref:protoporphyrinogen/coproporphyrinogen oxidase n=1 Tax=Chromobacterium sp. IIBBL 290-4 TaxID=2953890 RepID=UPI0020B69391|nr:NAD(P)/FAD-dependent oxidoreductase [Chromobacterium sp. IIBBL 290-4]UTH73186.1 FAD-dependent oxidoreductase [Chromobacterium sp. IIBBL 290-4]
METPKHIIVVGAGIAGLTAAWKLRQRGFAVTVLEAGDRPGGRIKSMEFHGHSIELGAQFPSSAYRYLPLLFQEADMAAHVRPLSAYAAMQRGKRLYRVHARRPWTPLSSGMLTWGEFLRLGSGAAALAWRSRGRNPSRLADFSDMDDIEADAWCRDKLGHAAAAHFIEPMVHGLYFHRLGGASLALVAAMMAFGGSDNLAVAGGWQSLPEALAARLDVRYGMPVDSLSLAEEGVSARAGGKEWKADAAVLAVPAHIAKGILAAPSKAEERLLATEYAPTLHIALGMEPAWQPPEALREVYGCLLAPSEGGRIASLTFESGRGLGKGNGEVVSIMLGSEAVSSLMGLDDEAVVADILAELESWLPGVGSAVVRTHVQRWAAAEPLSKVGRAAAIAEYRSTLPAERRVVLAGDYLSSPWTDGAAETGVWAAGHLEKIAED